MADRPWITPNDLRIYTSYDSVKNRDDMQLRMDISRAEQKIIYICNNDFADNLAWPTVPESVGIATTLVAEVYARNAGIGATGVGGTFKSESIGDYSYTMADVDDQISALNLMPLLEPYVIDRSNNQIELTGFAV